MKNSEKCYYLIVALAFLIKQLKYSNQIVEVLVHNVNLVVEF